MKKTGLVVVFLLLILGCQMAPNRPSIYDFIPENSNLVIEINNFERFKSALRNNLFLSKTSLNEAIEKHLGTVDSLNVSGPLLICTNLNHETPKFTFIAEQKDILQNSFSNIQSQILDSIWIGSEEVKNPISPSAEKHPFTAIQSLADTNSTLSLYHTSNKNSVWSNVFLNIHASPERLTLNGILLDTNAPNSVAAWLEINSTKPQKISDVAPEDLVSMESYNITDFNALFEKVKTHDSTAVVSSLEQSLLETFNEMGWIETSEGRGFIGHSFDMGATNEALIGFQKISENYRSVRVFEFNNPSFLSHLSDLTAEKFNPNLYTILDDFIIFSDNATFLKSLISSHQNKTTLAANANYKAILNQLSDDVSFQSTLDSESLSEILNAVLNTNFSAADLLAYKFSTLQLIKDDQVVHLNALLQKNKPKGTDKKIREEFSLVLDADILSEIQFVDNHLTNQKDIVVQDIENHLYLISNQGVVQWKKKLPGPILGQIQQVDLYKNGRLQLAFATPKRVHVLDRLGRDVGPFPLKFNDDISQPLAIFDYDANRNYRFLITQKNSLLMYDGRGQRVKGFNYSSESNIENTPKHIRHRGKDYIVFMTGENLAILNRRGQVRVPVREAVEFSNQDLYFYNNQFTTLNKTGELIQVDSKGRVSRQTLGFSAKTQMTASRKTLVAQWENYLQVKDQKIFLDFGQKTPPKLFYLNDTIYINVTDLDSNTIWFYDSQGRALAGFPVYGTSTIDLANADMDKALEFVGQSSSTSIVMYQLY